MRSEQVYRSKWTLCLTCSVVWKIRYHVQVEHIRQWDRSSLTLNRSLPIDRSFARFAPHLCSKSYACPSKASLYFLLHRLGLTLVDSLSGSLGEIWGPNPCFSHSKVTDNLAIVFYSSSERESQYFWSSLSTWSLGQRFAFFVWIHQGTFHSTLMPRLFTM